LGHFFHETSFIYVKIILFKSKFCKNSPVKETLVSTHPPWLCNYMKTRTCNIWDSLIWCTFKFCNIKKISCWHQMCTMCTHFQNLDPFVP
jgi:hypothetical protein